MRVVYFGMGGAFSLAPLAGLLDAGMDADVVACVLPGPVDGPPITELTPQGLPLVGAGPAYDMHGLARARGLPVYNVGTLAAPETLATLATLEADVGLVACFPRHLPPELLALPRHGFLNIHPSLLPAYRGPDPVFWTLRDGLRETGVTLHFMDEGLDTGDIVVQAPVTLPDGASGPELDRLLAAAGGELAAEALRLLAEGDLPRRAQPFGGSRQPSPGPDDFRLNVGWTAQHAYNFMRGTAEWGRPYPVVAGSTEFVLRSAGFVEPFSRLTDPYLHIGDSITIRFVEGALVASLI